MNEFWLNRGYSNIVSSDLYYHEVQFWLINEMTLEKATASWRNKTALYLQPVRLPRPAPSRIPASRATTFPAVSHH